MIGDASIKKFEPLAGFTLMESLIVISIIGIMAAVVATSLLGARNKNALTDGQTLIVRTLEDARGRALSGFGTTDYCVRIDASAVAFYGAICTGTPTISTTLPTIITTDQTTAANFIFKRITGVSSQAKIITLTNSITHATAKVTVTMNGQIFPY